MLTLNSSKTEFLFIGLKQELGKIHNLRLTLKQKNWQKYLKIKKNFEHDIYFSMPGRPCGVDL